MQWGIQYDPMNYIIEGLYLGNISAASDLKYLQKHGITHIVRVIKGDFGKVFMDNYGSKSAIKYKIIQVNDLPSENIQKYFESAYEFIDTALQSNKGTTINKVLVHCQVGMSRSATIVISYLMRKFPDMTLTKAFRFVKSKRPIVNPNEGFIRQLKAYQSSLENLRFKETMSKRIVAGLSNVRSSPYYDSKSKIAEKPPTFAPPKSSNYHYRKEADSNPYSRSRGLFSNATYAGNKNEEKKILDLSKFKREPALKT
ncbi:unnamed protein product [Moneuplotes crassus]|uniref:protein-tyrosine-phosphatase n=2 Tax=Euplotes crassus TaxID=5936 RepID=A0AAD1URM7_EUPCR|nr:unnamed protein product [Moneuplotes crassus]